MANVEVHGGRIEAAPLRWRELWLKEDWWAIWLGLGIVIIAYIFFANGSSIRWLAVSPTKWSNLAELQSHFAANLLPAKREAQQRTIRREGLSRLDCREPWRDLQRPRLDFGIDTVQPHRPA